MFKPNKNLFFPISLMWDLKKQWRKITYHMRLKLDTIIWWKIICRTAVLCLNKCLKTLSAHNMNYSDANFPFSFLFESKSLRYLKRMKPTNMQCVQRRKQRTRVQKHSRKMHETVIKMHGITEKGRKEKY